MIDAGGIMTAALLQKLVKPEMKNSEVFDWLFEYFKVCPTNSYNSST
jgi:hypothetical protein